MTWILQWLWGHSYASHLAEVVDDPLRASVWIFANLVVGFSYLGIPSEIWQWNRVFLFRFRFQQGSYSVANLFVTFIVFCGLSHFAMIAVMPTTRWEIIMVFFLPMAFISAATYVVLRVCRGQILAMLTALSGIAK